METCQTCWDENLQRTAVHPPSVIHKTDFDVKRLTVTHSSEMFANKNIILKD